MHVTVGVWVGGCRWVGGGVCVKHGYCLTGNNGRLQYLRFCLCEMYVSVFFLS